MYSGCWINNQNRETRVGEDSLEDLEQRRARLYDQLAATGDFRRGSISENYRRCGKPNCVCAQEGHPGMGRDICGRARWPGGVPRGGSSRSRRWTRCAPSWPTITVSRRSVSRSWRSTRRSARPAHRTRRPRRPRPAQRGTKRGLCDQIAAEFTAEVERLVALAVGALGSSVPTWSQWSWRSALR